MTDEILTDENYDRRKILTDKVSTMGECLTRKICTKREKGESDHLGHNKNCISETKAR